MGEKIIEVNQALLLSIFNSRKINMPTRNKTSPL